MLSWRRRLADHGSGVATTGQASDRDERAQRHTDGGEMVDDSGGVLDLSEFEEETDLDDVAFQWRDWRKAHREMCLWIA